MSRIVGKGESNYFTGRRYEVVNKLNQIGLPESSKDS